MLTRERIQETLDDAAARGRVTRKDANDLVAELVRRGRDETRRAARRAGGADRARAAASWSRRGARRAAQNPSTASSAAPTARGAAVGVGPSFPILGYDELNATQVQSRIKELSRPERRKVLNYERKHANRKSVVGALEKSLA